MPYPGRLLVAFLVGLGSASALTVVPSTVVLEPFVGNPSWEYYLRAYQDAAQTDYTAIILSYDEQTESLVYHTSVLDEGSDWYFVSSGQSFDWAGISGGAYAPFSGQSNRSVPVPYGEFYLGFTTGLGFTPPIPDANAEANRSVLGWAHFEASESGITLIDSAAAYDAGSIIVGTQNATAIPEPASAALLAGLGALALARGATRRRRAA